MCLWHIDDRGRRLAVIDGRRSRAGLPDSPLVKFDHVAQPVPDIAEALAWWQRTVPDARVLYADETWGLLEAGGAKLAFVLAEQHPQHLAFAVSGETLERLAGEHAAEIALHRDGSRSFYLEAPGDGRLEIIAYPDALEEDFE